MTAVCFDYDTDGDLDIYAGTYSGNNNILLRNNGDGTFSNVSDISGTPGQPSTRTCAFADFNNDGWLDLLVNDHYHGNHVYRNNTDGTFTEVAANLGLTGGFGDYFGLGWGDFDNDGALDLFVAGHFHIYRLYRNENCPHHWLKVRLQGTVDNTDAVGARLDLWAGELHTTRWVTAGEGASDFHSLEVEFGLGTVAFADSLKIVWPGGMQQTLVEVNGDMVLTVVQPESISSVDEIPENISGVKMSIHPNPFNPRTTVLFELSALGKISVEVFDVAGRRVTVLKDGIFEAGNYRINWDGLGSDGKAVASGVYYCRLSTEVGVAQEGMVLVR